MVISPPCHTPINRAVYAYMAKSLGIPIHIIVPKSHFVGGKWRETPNVEGVLPYEITLLPLKGTHGRLQRFEGLDKVIFSWKPTHLFLDNDPGTLMAWQVSKTAKSVNAKSWCMTAENLSPRYGRDFFEGLIKLKPSRIIGPLVTAFLRKIVHPKYDRIFCLSNDGTKVMEALGFKNKVTKIPLGFDPDLFFIHDKKRVFENRKKLGLNKTTIAYFGRIVPEKGVHLLLNALKEISDKPWQLLLDKFTEYTDSYILEIQCLIKTLGFSERVVFFESSHDKMPDFMNAADIVVLPSVSTPKWKEQYGRVIPEAMACGKLVIGSNSGAIPELIQDHGMIFKEGDQGDLEKKIREALSMDPEKRQSIGKIASNYARKELSIVKQVFLMAERL